jgi:hypothetical protein
LRKPKRPIPEPPPFITRLLFVLARIQLVIQESLPEDPIEALTGVTAWAWLERLAIRIDTLVIRMQQGTLKPLVPRTKSDTQSKSAPSGPHAWPIPRRRGWMLPFLRHHEMLVAGISSLLSEHEIRLLFGQEPARFGRLLRPLARALALPEPKPLLERIQPLPNPDAPQPQAAVAAPTPPPTPPPTSPPTSRPSPPAKPARSGWLDPPPSLWSTIKTT